MFGAMVQPLPTDEDYMSNTENADVILIWGVICDTHGKFSKKNIFKHLLAGTK